MVYIKTSWQERQVQLYVLATTGSEFEIYPGLEYYLERDRYATILLLILQLTLITSLFK